MCALAAGQGFFPLDRRLRLRRDSWTESLVEVAARLGTTQPSFAIAAETLAELTRIGISATTVWRHHQEVTRHIEAELKVEEQTVPPWAIGPDVESMEWIAADDPIEDHASVSIDGLVILIREEGYREVKMVSVSEVAEQEENQCSDSEEASMEGVEATDHQVERGWQDGPKLERHSYRAVLGDKAAFAPALKAELARRRVRAVKKITAVNDGAEWIWDQVQSYLPNRRVEVLDWPHAMQNLAKAAHAAWGEGTEKARAWLAQRETELWYGQRMKVDIALHQLPRRYKERGRAIRQVQGYIDHQWGRIRYDRFREEGRPIGSGTVESGAKNVVQWRMKRGGQRWSRIGATRMLAAVGEVHSKRWRPARRRFAKAA
jgi:hypothetical protein